MSNINPYELAVSAQGNSPMSQARRFMEPFISEHMEGFGKALEGRATALTPERVRAHTLMRVGMAAARQSISVCEAIQNRGLGMFGGSAAMEATLASSTLRAQITDFVTQMIHMSLDVYPRLIAPNLVSVQPFTQPSGYLFYLHRVAKNNGAGGTGSGRRLDATSTFDASYGDLGAEGDQLKAVGITLEKVLVECKFKGLMHQQSHQVDVALRSQYGFDLQALGDITTADELAWEVDREIVTDVIAFSQTNTRGTLYFDPTRGGTYDTLTPSEQKAYDQSFITKTFSVADTDMATDCYARPNWAICGGNVINLLRRTPNAYAMTTAGNGMPDQNINRGALLQTGVTPDGKKIWHDPQLDPDLMILGHVDNMNPFYAGYIYSPFGLASLLTAAFQDPDTLLTKKARALAFAKKGVRAQQFRRVKLGTTS